ncbi:MAG TPA: 30S ribosomal protein S5 [bacterium]|nr:30S ribosomal protein S5 [bacterium]
MAAERENRRNDRKKGGSFKEAPKEFREELLEVARVTRVTAGGRQLRFRAAIVLGNGKGKVGFGTGKASEVVVAIEKATRNAKRNMIDFPIVNGTVPFDTSAKYKASSVYIHPANPGTGLIAGGAVRKVLMVSGLKDVLAKQHGAPNNITNVRVIMKALQNLQANPKARALAEADRAARPVEEAAAAKSETKTEETKRMTRTKVVKQKKEEIVEEAPVEEVIETVETEETAEVPETSEASTEETEKKD